MQRVHRFDEKEPGLSSDSCTTYWYKKWLLLYHIHMWTEDVSTKRTGHTTISKTEIQIFMCNVCFGTRLMFQQLFLLMLMPPPTFMTDPSFQIVEVSMKTVA